MGTEEAKTCKKKQKNNAGTKYELEKKCRESAKYDEKCCHNARLRQQTEAVANGGLTFNELKYVRKKFNHGRQMFFFNLKSS